MEPHSSTLAGKSHGWRSLESCSSWGRWESDTTERLHFHLSLSCIGEGNGNPLQCSCLENPRDRGAWWAAVYGSHRVGHDWSDLAAAALGSLKKQESFRKTSTSALLTMPKPLTVKITTNCGNSSRYGNTRPPDLPLEKSPCRSKSNS